MKRKPTNRKASELETKHRTSFEPMVRDGTEDGQLVFLAGIPSEIEEIDFGKDWWPRLKGFPLNITYSRAYATGLTSALYAPDLETFRETEAERELTYRNKLGGAYRVQIVQKTGGIEARKYRGNRVIALSCGKDFSSAMTQATMIGLQEDEPAEMFLIGRSG